MDGFQQLNKLVANKNNLIDLQLRRTLTQFEREKTFSIAQIDQERLDVHDFLRDLRRCDSDGTQESKKWLGERTDGMRLVTRRMSRFSNVNRSAPSSTTSDDTGNLDPDEENNLDSRSVSKSFTSSAQAKTTLSDTLTTRTEPAEQKTFTKAIPQRPGPVRFPGLRHRKPLVTIKQPDNGQSENSREKGKPFNNTPRLIPMDSNSYRRIPFHYSPRQPLFLPQQDTKLRIHIDEMGNVSLMRVPVTEERPLTAPRLLPGQYNRGLQTAFSSGSTLKRENSFVRKFLHSSQNSRPSQKSINRRLKSFYDDLKEMKLRQEADQEDKEAKRKEEQWKLLAGGVDSEKINNK